MSRTLHEIKFNSRVERVMRSVFTCGHADVRTTEIYTHVAVGQNGCGVRSPLDG